MLIVACSKTSSVDQKYAEDVMAAFAIQENQYQMAIQHATNDSARGSMGHGMGIEMWNMSLFEMSEILSDIHADGVNEELVVAVAELIDAADDFIDFYTKADSSTKQIDIAKRGDRVQRQKIAIRELFTEKDLIED